VSPGGFLISVALFIPELIEYYEGMAENSSGKAQIIAISKSSRQEGGLSDMISRSLEHYMMNHALGQRSSGAVPTHASTRPPANRIWPVDWLIDPLIMRPAFDKQKDDNKVASEVANESVTAFNIADEVADAIDDSTGEADGEINGIRFWVIFGPESTVAAHLY
jgi:hypothetical protein